MRRALVLVLVGCTTSPVGSTQTGGGGQDLAVPVEDLASASDAAVPVSDAAMAPTDAAGPCLPGMVYISADGGTFCVDQYEAHVIELTDGGEQPHSPFLVVNSLRISARVARGVYPQGYISQVQATMACANAGKRLCNASEFALACRGPDAANFYPYGGTMKKAGYCNEGKGSSVARFFGSNPNNWTYANFNDPRLNQWDGGLAETGAYPQCVSPYGVHDCVGSLHEWGSDAPDVNNHGRFRGGFYGDAEINGKGCLYVTRAHEPTYHDYSTGFRCCADPK